MKIFFAHGKESGPWGFKIKRLAKIAEKHLFTVESVDYSGMFDPEERVDKLKKIIEVEEQPYVLAGSSMGGYVSQIVAQSSSPKGVFLMAPAFYFPGYDQHELIVNCCTEVVHGWGDEIIPIDHSIKFCKKNDITLHAICGDHGLNQSINEIEKLFEMFLNKLKKSAESK